MKRLLFVTVSLLASPSTLLGQADQGNTTSPRTATATAGVGNAMGWLGAQAELYFSNDRLSVFAGLGYTPALEDAVPSGITGAAGLRAFTHGIRHRGFVELSVTQVVVYSASPAAVPGVPGTGAEDARLYGPGLQLGYQYAALSGFTIMVSLGAGVALGASDAIDTSVVQPLGGLGVGYTWR